jgi:hypothetical protein
MNVKNYTSQVAVSRNISEIERLLATAGARTITKFYDASGEVDGFFFNIDCKGVLVMFRMPANVDAVKDEMLSKIKKRQKGAEKRVTEQAFRTAWALLRDWVHVQLSMIAIQKLDALQVFLPYQYDERSGLTFYNKLVDGGMKLLKE